MDGISTQTSKHTNMIKLNDQGKIVHDSLTLIPAYGRQPLTIKEATHSFLGGQDWILVHLGNSTYCSIRDFAPGTWVTLRFRHLRSVTHCKVPVNAPLTELLDKPRVLRHHNLLDDESRKVPGLPDAETKAALVDFEMLSPAQTELPYDGAEGQWPGDGSGLDDLADAHANEGRDE
jgi:hypothetical protein